LNSNQSWRKCAAHAALSRDEDQQRKEMAGLRGGCRARALRRLPCVHLSEKKAGMSPSSRPTGSSEDLVFTDGGLRALTSRTHHLGPVAIDWERAWSQEQARPDIGLKWR